MSLVLLFQSFVHIKNTMIKFKPLKRE